MTIGIILVVIGLVFFARAIGYLDEFTLSVLWPLLVVILGFVLVSHKVFGHDDKNAWWCQPINWQNKKRKR